MCGLARLIRIVVPHNEIDQSHMSFYEAPCVRHHVR
jgi:hypothetical protein